MPKVVVTAQVEDSVKWETGSRTHGELFRSETVSKPIHVATITGNEVACCFEPEDVDTFLRAWIPQRLQKPWPLMASSGRP